jgi:hypothetical protein
MKPEPSRAGWSLCGVGFLGLAPHCHKLPAAAAGGRMGASVQIPVAPLSLRSWVESPQGLNRLQGTWLCLPGSVLLPQLSAG